MPDALRRLFEHLRWADAAAVDALRRATPTPAAALEVYAHLVGAEHVWLARLRGEAPSVAVWPALELEECAALARRNADGYAAYLGGLRPEELGRKIPYRNSAGRAFESAIEDILLHVALHGSYHRGQMALLLRRSGAEPAATDYIAFVRGAPAATRES